MKYLFELSKDHEMLPQAEVLSCLKAENISYKLIQSDDNVVIIESSANIKKIKEISDRLSLVFYIDNFLFSCNPVPEKIKNNALKNKIQQKGTIAIKYKNRSNNIDSKNVIEALADIYTKNREVNLENPDIEVRTFITDSKIYVGIRLFEINRSQFEERKVQFRPFFSPISLHPKIARALVNLSEVKKSEKLLDPFCGTGGILLEAGLIGVEVIGSDIENKMIDGCKETLEHYNIKNYKLFCSDIGNIANNLEDVDAIVTDFPYGKAATTKGENVTELYKRAFVSMSKVLKKDGFLIAGLSDQNMISLGEKYLKILDRYELKVHSSLTRYFVVYKNISNL